MPYLSVKLFLTCPRPTFFLLDSHFRTIFILKRFFLCDFHFCFPFTSVFSTLLSQLLHNRSQLDLVSTLPLRNSFVSTPFEVVFTSKAFLSAFRFVSQTLIPSTFQLTFNVLVLQFFCLRIAWKIGEKLLKIPFRCPRLHRNFRNFFQLTILMCFSRLLWTQQLRIKLYNRLTISI